MSEISNDLLRYQILEILYQRASERVDWRVNREEIIKLIQAPENQIDFGVLYLHEIDLAKVREVRGNNWSSVIITGKGIDVIEHKQKFAEQLPFIQVAIQKIDAVYGNAIQAINSQVTLNQQITDAFKQAYSLIDLKKIPEEEKNSVRKKLEDLELELRKEKLDAGRAQNLWGWLKANASWLVPTLVEVFMESVKKAWG